jgi:hypothetical protein
LITDSLPYLAKPTLLLETSVGQLSLPLAYLDLVSSRSRVGSARYGRDSVINKILKHPELAYAEDDISS